LEDVADSGRQEVDRGRDGVGTRRSEERYRALFDKMDQGVCVCEMILDAAGRPVDYRFLEVNRLFAQMTGLVDAVGKTARQLVPNLEDHWFELYGTVALTGEPARFVQGSEAMGRWFEVSAFRVGDPEDLTFAILFTDITERRQAENAVREAQERFRVFADTAPAMLWVTDPDGRCSFLSRGWYEYTGQSEQTGLDFGWLNAVHADDREASRTAFLQASQQRRAFALEHRLRTADGAYRWVIDAGRPRSAADGSFAGFIGSVIDIHDRKQAEERLDMIVNSSEIGLWYCDLPFDELIWNSKVKEHFGLPADARVTIDTFYERLHPDDRERTRQAIEESIAKHLPYDIEYRTVGLDGRQRWLRAIGRTTYQDDRPIRFDGITIDVTDRLMQAEALREADRLKDEFLATLAHELRNPLAPLRNGLEILRLGAADGDAVTRAREAMERQLAQMVRLVDDLLDVSRISQGKLSLRRERADLSAILASAVETSRPLLEAAQHQLTLNSPATPVYVDGDVTRLAQVFANLLNNAAKFTAPGGRIEIAVATDAEHVNVIVRDNGIGIPAPMLPRVFDPFTQVRRGDALADSGLGIGLTIVKRLVQMHGGTVEARSRGEGLGSEFSVHLPRQSAPAPTQPRAADTAGSPPPLRVLVVDDNHDAALTLAMLLELLGHQTTTVHDGEAALLAAERDRPDIVLLDIGMPGMDGYEVARRMRQQPWAEGITLIALTGWGQERDKSLSRAAGFDHHLVKPAEPATLKALLSEAQRRTR
jgi:PAS domain S-box-containing protein